MSNLTQNNDQLHQNMYPDDEMGLKELLKVLWSGRRLISAFTGLAAVISVAFSLSLPNVYTSSALLDPAKSSGDALSGLMKQYGGLASLTGISLPGSEDGSQGQLGMQLMKSRAFIGDFVDRHGILKELMAVDSWDLESGELAYDPDIYDSTSQKWVREVKPPRASKPSAQEAYKAFLKLLDISENNKTGYITVSISHQSPRVAAQWVTWLVDDVNYVVKSQDVSEAEKSIEYLKQQVASTSLTDLQSMFFELIQSQTETVMLAEVRPEYVFKTIDPAIVPEEKSKPSRAVICILGTILGGLLGAIAALIRYYMRDKSID